VWQYYPRMFILIPTHFTVTFIVSTGAIVTNLPCMMLMEMGFVATMELTITLSSTTMISLQKVASLDSLKRQFDSSEMDVLLPYDG